MNLRDDSERVPDEGREIPLPQEATSGSQEHEEGSGGTSPEEEIPKTGVTVLLYVLKDPRDLSIRYVGKTSNTLAFRLRQHVTYPKNRYVVSWIRSLAALGLIPIIEEIERIENSDGLEWQERERFWITEFRAQGCRLTNLDAGGHGGNLRCDETKERIGKGNKGKKRTPEQIEKLRRSHLGKKLSPEHVANMSKAVKGKPRGKYAPERVAKVAAAMRGRKRPRTPEHQAKITAKLIGRKLSDESRAKISAFQKGKKRGPYSPERIAKAAAALKGRVIPPEQKEKMRLAAIERHRLRRERGEPMRNQYSPPKPQPPADQP